MNERFKLAAGRVKGLQTVIYTRIQKEGRSCHQSRNKMISCRTSYVANTEDIGSDPFTAHFAFSHFSLLYKKVIQKYLDVTFNEGNCQPRGRKVLLHI